MPDVGDATHPVIDGHNDLPWAVRNLVDYDVTELALATGEQRTHTDLPRLRRGGVGGQFWSVYVPAELTGDEAVSATLEQIDFVHSLIETHPEQLSLATAADAVKEALEQGRIASLMGAEGGHSIASSMGTLRMLHRLGVRYLTLTHNSNVPWADSATDEPCLGGLSPFGKEVVREMNRLGMLVDLSHVAPSTMRDALSCTESPVIFSHSSARAICDHPRNVPDDVLAALPGNGGLCMVTFVPHFVSPAVREWDLEAIDAAAAEGISAKSYTAYLEFCRRRAQTHPVPEATIADVVAHVEHVREVAGINHVGLGGDYDGVDHLPKGLEDVSGYPRLLTALADRGWSADDLARLTHRNVIRVLRDAEEKAQELQRTRRPSVARIHHLDPAQPTEEPH